jgi:tetratricopeptide (TPR) repeat protein/transcriptional regulator with XRE-family HTH domain
VEGRRGDSRVVAEQPAWSFAELLRELRAEARLTQEELAEAASLSPRSVSDLERGIHRTAHRDTARLLADALGLAEPVRGLFVAAARGRVPAAEVLAARADAPAALAATVVTTSPGPAAVPVPRELPADVGGFAGRAVELAELDLLLPDAIQDDGGGPVGPVVISAVSGTAGVGKTALAVRWAHRVAAAFPDGQLYVNLRGYDPDRPVSAAEALAGFLRALGVAGQDIPLEEAERAARFRSLVAGRRLLVVLDNAASVEQVRPLLPGTGSAMVVVTSRDSLAGLVARDGARRLDLDLLPAAEAVALLRALIGGRAEADPAAAEALAGLCARLPLALRVAAELAVARPAVSLTGLASELTDQRRLDLLDAGGDSRTAVRAVFSWSYQHLDPGVARGLRLAGLHSGPDFDRYAVAALTGMTADQAINLLDALARAYLIHGTGPGRYSMHDLLRSYARELAACHDGAAEARAALTHLFDYYLRSAAAAIDTMFPAESDRRGRLPAPAAGPPVADPAAALAWLDTERACLVAAIAYTAANGWPRHTTRLAATLCQYLENGGYFPEAIIIHDHAQRAARLTGDRCAEANALNNLGRMDCLQGRYQQAVGHLQQALASFRESGDLNGQARALVNLGTTAGRQGHYLEAASRFQEALILFRETEDQPGQARTLNNLGIIDLIQGRYQQAIVHLQVALTLEHEAGNRAGELIVLNNLGLADLRAGHYQRARGHIERALALCSVTGDRLAQAHLLATIGEVDLRQHCYEQALANCQRSLALCSEIGDRYSQVTALNGLGETLLAISRPAEAHEQHAAALGLAVQTGNKYGQARAHDGLARCYNAVRDSGQARSHWQQALLLYSSLGAPEADQPPPLGDEPGPATGPTGRRPRMPSRA